MHDALGDNVVLFFINRYMGLTSYLVSAFSVQCVSSLNKRSLMPLGFDLLLPSGQQYNSGVMVFRSFYWRCSTHS